MTYVTGIHALNLNCSLETCGDWHQSALAWRDVTLAQSEESIFGDWGIELNKHIPEHEETYSVANHIRACLDLISEGKFDVAQGMRENFICNEEYNQIIFEKVALMVKIPHWEEIDKFIESEYMMQWIYYKEAHGYGTTAAE
jgi:hypothetical protein